MHWKMCPNGKRNERSDHQSNVATTFARNTTMILGASPTFAAGFAESLGLESVLVAVTATIDEHHAALRGCIIIVALDVCFA